MKSQQLKKLHQRDEATRKAAEAARSSNRALLNLYEAFIPATHIVSRPSKFINDKWGNRVLRGTGVKVQ